MKGPLSHFQYIGVQFKVPNLGQSVTMETEF